jgi:hypothetical protein
MTNLITYKGRSVILDEDPNVGKSFLKVNRVLGGES